MIVHPPLELWTREDLLSRIEFGMEEALLETGSCSVEDGYRMLGEEELAVAKARQFGQIAVRKLKAARCLRRVAVENSREPSRKGGYRGRWTR